MKVASVHEHESYILSTHQARAQLENVSHDDLVARLHDVGDLNDRIVFGLGNAVDARQ